jgi:hypothetical protein
LESGRREGGKGPTRPHQGGEEAGDVEIAVLGLVGGEAARRLLELTLACDGAPGYAGMMPRDGDVDETLEEVPLTRLRGAPGLLERLVRRKVPPARDQREAAFVAGVDDTRHEKTVAKP